MACLLLGFDGFDAEFAQTGLWHDNAASLGVTQSLGYGESGRRRALRRGQPDEMAWFRMPPAHWEAIRRDDITLSGIQPSASFLGV